MDNMPSLSDIAAVTDRRNDDMNGSWLWFLAILVLMGGYGNFNNNPGPMMGPGFATQADVTAGLNNSSIQSQLQQIALSSANNNYETAQLVNGQTTQLLQQNNTNLINAIQGFNAVNQNLIGQGAMISQAISDLGYHLDQCCCSIKTQMLEDRLEDTRTALVAAQGSISNANQSQYLLGQLGRFVAWNPSGTQAATGTVAG